MTVCIYYPYSSVVVDHIYDNDNDGNCNSNSNDSINPVKTNYYCFHQPFPLVTLKTDYMTFDYP